VAGALSAAAAPAPAAAAPAAAPTSTPPLLCRCCRAPLPLPCRLLLALGAPRARARAALPALPPPSLRCVGISSRCCCRMASSSRSMKGSTLMGTGSLGGWGGGVLVLWLVFCSLLRIQSCMHVASTERLASPLATTGIPPPPPENQQHPPQRVLAQRAGCRLEQPRVNAVRMVCVPARQLPHDFTVFVGGQADDALLRLIRCCCCCCCCWWW